MYNQNNDVLLEVKNLSKTFINRNGMNKAVDNVSFNVKKGEILGLIGQSGSGKSTIANSLMKLFKEINGVITFENKVVSGNLSWKNNKNFYKEVQMIFQDPHTSLNEKRNILSTLAEPLKVHKIDVEKTKKFLENDKNIFDTFELSFKMEFLKKKLDFENFKQKINNALIVKNRSFLDHWVFSNEKNIIENIDELIQIYYENIILSENEKISFFKKQIDELLFFYEEAREKIDLRNLSYDEVDLINAREELLNFNKSTNKKLHSKEMNNIEKKYEQNIKNLVNETRIIFKNFYKDKIQNVKLNKILASISKTNEEKNEIVNKIIFLKKQVNLIKQLLDKEIILEPKKIFDFFEIFNEKTIHDSIEIDFNVFEKNSLLETKNIIYKLEEEKNKTLNSIIFQEMNLKDFENKKTILNKNLNEANIVFEKEKNLFKKSFSEDYQALKEQIDLVSSRELKKEFKNKMIELSKLMIQKVSFILEKSKNHKTDLSHYKKNIKKYEQKIKQYKIENKVISKNMFCIKILFGVIKSIPIIKFLFIKNFLTYKMIMSALEQVGLKPEHAYRYPHEFSGGQKQRINIARALIIEPKLIIADEPIASLDVSIQAQIINILIDLVKQKNISMIFIGHDLSVLEYLANTILVMHLGKIVEKGVVEKVFSNPIHPYTKVLFKSIPKISNANLPFESLEIDLNYIKEYNEEKPNYKIVENDHFVLANDSQFSVWNK